jgi:hypothetical protein
MAGKVFVGTVRARVIEPAPGETGRCATTLPDDLPFRLRKSGFDEIETLLLRELLTGPCSRDRRTRAA